MWAPWVMPCARSARSAHTGQHAHPAIHNYQATHGTSHCALSPRSKDLMLIEVQSSCACVVYWRRRRRAARRSCLRRAAMHLGCVAPRVHAGDHAHACVQVSVHVYVHAQGVPAAAHAHAPHALVRDAPVPLLPGDDVEDAIVAATVSPFGE